MRKVGNFMDYGKMAEPLSSQLGLDIPPIALTFVETVPPGVQSFDQAVPSACAVWRKAEERVFYASAEQHYNCPIGVMTMGFPMPQTVQQELMGVAQMMVGCGYLAADEPEKIPSIQKNKTGIVYGPLKELPIDPDLGLLWLTPQQGMLFSEAVRACSWTETSPATVLGRPACAALPVAFSSGRATLSFGCAGVRAFTGIHEDHLLGVLPGNKLQEFLESLGPTIEANKTMRTYYEGHKARFVV